MTALAATVALTVLLAGGLVVGLRRGGKGRRSTCPACGREVGTS